MQNLFHLMSQYCTVEYPLTMLYYYLLTLVSRDLKRWNLFISVRILCGSHAEGKINARKGVTLARRPIFC